METIYDLEYVQKRLKYVLLIGDGHMTISEGARKAGVTWKTMKSWIHRYNEYGIKGLLNKPRGRLNPVPDDIKQIIVDIKIENRSRSGRKIRDILLENHRISFHRQTVWSVLKAAGENKRVKQTFKVYHDFERLHPNSLWQVDFMEGIVIEGVGLVYLLVFIDDYSRKIVGARFFTEMTEQNVLDLLWWAIEQYGMPLQIYSDQGTQFKSHWGKGHTRFEKVCKRLGIETIFASVRYPEGKGKIERLFGFIQDDFLPEFRFSSFDDINQKFNEWVKWYNEKHEHSSLCGHPPNSRYKNFTPHMPEGDLFEIFAEHVTRKVRKNATISLNCNVYPVDPEYVNEKVNVLVFGSLVRIYGKSKLLGEYDSQINYHEKMLRRVHTRLVKKDGVIKFQNEKYHIGIEFVGKRVDLVIIRNQLRAFLDSKHLQIFKLRERDAVVVKVDR